jgi:hypothetical protein
VDSPPAMIGASVQQLRFDYQVTFIFLREAGLEPRVAATLVIEAPFQMTTNGQKVEVHPGQPETYPPVLRFLNSKIIGVELSEAYDLSLEFEGGSALNVGPTESFDAWQLSGEGVPNLFVGPAQFKARRAAESPPKRL